MGNMDNTSEGPLKALVPTISVVVVLTGDLYLNLVAAGSEPGGRLFVVSDRGGRNHSGRTHVLGLCRVWHLKHVDFLVTACIFWWNTHTVPIEYYNILSFVLVFLQCYAKRPVSNCISS